MTSHWDDAFDNSSYVPEAAQIIAELEARSSAYRRQDFAECDVAYGAHPREKIDIFHPEGVAKGLVVFIHGGYWMRMDRPIWSALAEGARSLGWAVAMPGYPLTPEVRITDIVASIHAAVTAAADRIAGPVRITGHSAGGHLAARMACTDGPVGDRLAKVVSISGLHDLRNFLKAEAMNATLGLSEAEAVAQSPAFLHPREVPVHAWVGGEERPELIRQSRLLAEAWPDAGLTIDPACNHFNVILGLAEAEHPLTKTLLEQEV